MWSFAFIIVGLLLLPSNALAWGPAAHLDFALQTLAAPALLTPSVLQLLRRHRMDFFHGTLAADIIVGKNRAAAHDHSHGWRVARELLRLAETEGAPRHAFMLGYIHHLGADIVAHNHVIPELLVHHFRVKSAGHLYFESRVDQQLLILTPGVDAIWHETAALDFREHDSFLNENLVATIFSNRVSSALYRSNLDLQRAAPWRLALARIEKHSRIRIDSQALFRWRKLAIYCAARAVLNPWSPRLDRLDPTGHDALKTAEGARKTLRREFKRGNAHLIHLHHELLSKVSTVSLDHFESDAEIL